MVKHNLNEHGFNHNKPKEQKISTPEEQNLFSYATNR